MKKFMLAALFITAITACNSNDNEDQNVSGDKVSGVENVNGNIPDTTNTINLGGDKDTTLNPANTPR